MRPVPPYQRPSIERADSLTVTVARRRHRGAVLCAHGHLDAATGGLLAAVVEYEARCGYRRIGIDLSEITHLDEPALAVLRDAYLQLRANGGRLDVYGLHPSRLETAPEPQPRAGTNKHRRAALRLLADRTAAR